MTGARAMAWPAWAGAGGITLGLFVALPFLQSFSPPARDLVTLHRLVPAPLPHVSPFAPEPVAVAVPEPPIAAQRPGTPVAANPWPVGAALDTVAGAPALPGLSVLHGDFDLAFPLRADGMGPGAVPPASEAWEPGDLDVPPRPIFTPAPVYPARAQALRVEGAVALEFVVTRAGTVEKVSVVHESRGAGLADAAVAAVRQWTFEPGRKDGAPVATRVRQTIKFQADE